MGDYTPVKANSGLGKMSDDERKEKFGKIGLIPVFMIVPRIITFAIAYCCYRFGDTKFYDAQIEFLTQHRLGYPFIGFVAFSMAVNFLNMYPGRFKSAILPSGTNFAANMHVYKVLDRPDLPYVVLEEDGPVGIYNRANRSLFHFTENVAYTITSAFCAVVVFPFQVMVCILVFSFGRIIHQVGYTQGYGTHAPGFMLAMISTGTMEMLVLVSALKSLGVPLH
eukprot:gnl/TRDRNA2_/TRDRNA2_198435_c0_seq1.p2 gnl/TRDRNA2_/TRDRNA2_198435_c0~~gnl/TRDRNA2_/TRDRNA2_198435_c0_seq1.p2  ORF type:complete len:223 (-),score=31.10 gnl/TRDRNA2_/TRDRNA2_198435_c0_seq1:105-773(-)